MDIRYLIDPETGLPHIHRHGVTEEEMNQSKYPVGWDEERVRRVLEHYEVQSDEEAVAEDEAGRSVRRNGSRG